MDYIDLLRKGFGEHVSVQPKRPGIMKLVAPLYHEDGDMVDIFLQEAPGGRIRICDHGLTLMRLSYTYDIDTPNKERIFNQILQENNIGDDDGNLFIEVFGDEVYAGVLHFGQVVAKVSSMSLYKRAVISDLFYEMVHEFVFGDLREFHPVEQVKPISNREELEVDYVLEAGVTPIFVFAAKEREVSKVRLIAISCLEFIRKDMKFRSIVVHQNYDSLSKKDINIITSASDKQFISFDDFKEHGAMTIRRLAA